MVCEAITGTFEQQKSLHASLEMYACEQILLNYVIHIFWPHSPAEVILFLLMERF